MSIFKLCFQKVSWLWLLLPRQKLRINETLISFKNVFFGFNILIPEGFSIGRSISETPFLYSVKRRCHIFLMSFNGGRIKKSHERKSGEYGGGTFAQFRVFPKTFRWKSIEKEFIFFKRAPNYLNIIPLSYKLLRFIRILRFKKMWSFRLDTFFYHTWYWIGIFEVMTWRIEHFSHPC